MTADYIAQRMQTAFHPGAGLQQLYERPCLDKGVLARKGLGMHGEILHCWLLKK